MAQRNGRGSSEQPSLFGRVLTRRDADALASALRALGDPARLRLLSAVAASGSLNVTEMMTFVSVSQPTVSHHLKVLHEAGLVERAKRGTWVVYSAVPERLAELGDAFALPRRSSNGGARAAARARR
jgi:ArsR family transcriptional regulator